MNIQFLGIQAVHTIHAVDCIGIAGHAFAGKKAALLIVILRLVEKCNEAGA